MATVLVADDDSNTRLLVRTVLGYAGHSVLEAKDGREALGVAAEHRPQLILLDLSMPSMSGPEFLRALRADARTSRTPVALYTATVMGPTLHDFIEIYGICEVIPKPSGPAELLASVERALKHAHDATE